IKAKLIEGGNNLNKYANPSAVIHNTLKRLESQGEVIPVRNASNAPAYALAPPRIDESAWAREYPSIHTLGEIAAHSKSYSDFEAFVQERLKTAEGEHFPKREGGS